MLKHVNHTSGTRRAKIRSRDDEDTTVHAIAISAHYMQRRTPMHRHRCLRAYVCCRLEAHAFLTPVCFDMESVRVPLTISSAGPVTPARDGRGRVACGKPAYGRLSSQRSTLIWSKLRRCLRHANEPIQRPDYAELTSKRFIQPVASHVHPHARR